jgi:hypothetical protein
MIKLPAVVDALGWLRMEPGVSAVFWGNWFIESAKVNHNVVARSEIIKETRCYLAFRTTSACTRPFRWYDVCITRHKKRANLTNEQMRQILEEARAKLLANALEDPGLLSEARRDLEKEQKAD